MQIMRLLTIKSQSRHYVRRPRLTLHVAPSGERLHAIREIIHVAPSGEREDTGRRRGCASVEANGRRRGCASVEANGRCRGCASVEAVVGGAV